MTPISNFSKKSRCIPWLRMILNVIPSVVFGVFTVVFTLQQNSFSQATQELGRQQELHHRKKAVFDNCIDVISNLLLSPHFNRSDVKHLRPVREKVLTALRQIDATQKRDIIFFLYSNDLIRNDIPSAHRLDLRGADLNDVHFVKSMSVHCILPNLYLRGVLASNIVFSGCQLQNADFGESVMDRSLFHDCFLAFAAFMNTNLERAMFVNSIIYTVNLAGASLFQSSFTNNSVFLNTNWTNTNLFKSNITNQDLLGILPAGPTTIIVNTRFPNGSFLIDKSQLVIDGGAEKECNTTSNLTQHWHASLENFQMQTHKQVENSTVYPLPVEGNCYFIAKKMALVSQDVDVRRFSKFIDSGRASTAISAHFGCSQVDERDEAVVSLGYLDANLLPITTGPTIRTSNKPFHFQSQTGSIPTGTRTIKFYLGGSIPTSEMTGILRYCVFDDVKLFIFDNNQT